MVVCDSPAPLDGHKSTCCVFNYDAVGRDIGGRKTCKTISSVFPLNQNEISAADCVRGVVYNNAVGFPLPPVPYGEIKECCRDCNPPAKKLVLSGGRLVRNGGDFAMSPEDEPEKCCCGDKCVCKEVPEDCNHVRCYGTTDPQPADKCKGRCVIKTYDDTGTEVIDDRQVICATQVQCCADDNAMCEQTCKDGNPAVTYEPAANSWAAMPCTSCGVCCVNNYDEDPVSPTFRQVLSKTGTKDKTQAECEARTIVLFPNPTPLPVGVWHTGTDNVNICNPNCCQQQIRGDEKAAVCAPTSATTCDPCLGRCIEIEYENNPAKCPREECKSKQDCCGAGGEKCRPQCAGTTAKYRWETGCGDGSKCGTCCKAIYNNEGAVIELTCDEATTTLAECEKLVGIGDDPSGNPLPDSAYGSWFPFGTCAECDATPCCREITCEPGKTDTICVNVAKKDCDLCDGTCTELTTNNKTCAHYRECCGDDGENCESVCGSVATHRWSANGCTNPDLCGACCRTEYSSDTDTVPDVTCVEDIKNSSDCKLTDEDKAKQLDGYIISYNWKPFETCETAKCGTKKCCGEKCPGDVGCIDIDINAECDPCKGRCFDKAAGTASCQTKQACCGEDGVLCNGCPGTGTGGTGGTPAAFEWSGCAENGLKCGVCCVVTKNSLGVITAVECVSESYEKCTARGENASWKEFETCATAKCAPKKCCGKTCADKVGCIDVDFNKECDPCKSRCIDTATGDESCKSKQDCCGDGGEKCAPQCGEATAKYKWEDECADGSKCGICCKNIYNDDGTAITGVECDAGKETQTACEELTEQLDGMKPYGSWYAFGTCAECDETVKDCREIECADGTTRAVCVDVPISKRKNQCKGICTEVATGSTTCKTKQACCGDDNFKCGICGIDPEYSWAQSACGDAATCGACCIVERDEDGNVVSVDCSDDKTAATCIAETATQTASWLPFETCASVDCATKNCCGEGCGGVIGCISVPFDTTCNPCHGRCVPVDADGNQTGADFCATKQECCGDNNSKCADSECADPHQWTPTCAENSAKCGVCCELAAAPEKDPPYTTTCHEISQSECSERNRDGTGNTFLWKPYDTCDSVICLPQTCCGEICDGKSACTQIDISENCNKCKGVCETLDEDGKVIATTCSKRIECCGPGDEKCTPVCASVTPNKRWSGCAAIPFTECGGNETTPCDFPVAVNISSTEQKTDCKKTMCGQDPPDTIKFDFSTFLGTKPSQPDGNEFYAGGVFSPRSPSTLFVCGCTRRQIALGLNSTKWELKGQLFDDVSNPGQKVLAYVDTKDIGSGCGSYRLIVTRLGGVTEGDVCNCYIGNGVFGPPSPTTPYSYTNAGSCARMINSNATNQLPKFSAGGVFGGAGFNAGQQLQNLTVATGFLSQVSLWSISFRSPITFSGKNEGLSDQTRFPELYTGSISKSSRRVVGQSIYAVDDQPPRWKPCYPGILSGKNWRVIFEEQQVVVMCYECGSPVTCTNIKRKYKVLVCDGDYNTGSFGSTSTKDVTDDVLIDEPYMYHGQSAGSRTDYEICAQRRFDYPNFTYDYNDCGCHLGSAEYMPFPDAQAFTALPENIASVVSTIDLPSEEENPLP